ncbi:hypothetical protein [Streptomyces sp. NPDC007355]|uniref:hypothetical protein n=1 Tax=Streptomyces sp. NPDC007355 TaxID=3364778 RepID=UPI0036979DCB
MTPGDEGLRAANDELRATGHDGHDGHSDHSDHSDHGNPRELGDSGARAVYRL